RGFQMRPAIRLIAVNGKPAARHARASMRYASASCVLTRRFAKSYFEGRQPCRPIWLASRRARLRKNSGVSWIFDFCVIAIPRWFVCRDASQSEAPQRRLEQRAQRQHRIDTGLGAQFEYEDWPLLRGGLGGVGGCHGYCGADRRRRELPTPPALP